MARISEIVTQTLRFYREPSKPTLVRLPEVVDSALILYQSKLAYAEIVIEKDFRKCSPIVGMAGEIRQVILNLIGNALDASSQGGGLKIRVSNALEHSNGARPGVRLTVADTGSGISPAMRRTLFEPFVSTKGDTGTGLGLWISSEIVRRHNGKIQVRSSTLSQSSWTVFSVFLPLIQTLGNRTLATGSMTLDGKSKEAQSDAPPAMAIPMQRARVT